MRGVAAFFLIHFLAVTFAPGWIVADFLVERSRIEQELCVQRMVPDDLRTCHGECQLSKRLKDMDQREANLPNELKAVHLDQVVPGTEGIEWPMSVPVIECAWARSAEDVRDGYPQRMAPVPWAGFRA